jgi:tetratricopeptide (TPR) repeat protein
MRVKSNLRLALFSLAVALSPAFAQAQGTGKIHGHVQDPAKTAIPNAQVVLSLDGVTAKYTFTTDANGDYTGGGIAPGTYVVTLFQSPGKAVDRFTGVKITADQDTAQDFDLSRPEYINKLSPADRKALEEAMQKNAAAMKENQSIANLNVMLKQARTDTDQKKYDDAANLMQQATQQKPDAPELWQALGAAQVGQKKYPDAITSLKKAIDLENASKKPNAELLAAANNGLGEAYGSSNQIPESQAAYDAAAKAQPSNAYMYYNNETIIFSRTTNTDATVAAADKAIAVDPTKPIPYYLKAQALISKATVDPKTGKISAPPGCVESYQKYLQLDPNGPFANDAKQILAQLSGGKK